MTIRLGDNQYGKAEIRLVRVDRSAAAARDQGPQRVDVAARRLRRCAHDRRQPRRARDRHPEEHRVRLRPAVRRRRDRGLRAAARAGTSSPRPTRSSGAKITHRGVRLGAGSRSTGGEHDHAFTRVGGGTRTTVVTLDGPDAWVVSGISDLVVLKSTGSEFHGFPRDRYTTLAETTDRILATAVTARWRYANLDVDWDAALRRHQADPARIVRRQAQPGPAADAVLHGRAGARGAPRGGRDPDVDAEQAPLPGRPVGRSGCPTTTRSTTPTTGPYGLIEGAVVRDDAPDAGPAWLTVPGFC